MGYIMDLKDIAPGEELMMLLEKDGGITVDFASREGEYSDFLESEIIVFVEVSKVIFIETREKEG